MIITNMKCNHITNPLGFNLGQPLLSWVTEGSDAQFQIAAQILVSKSSAFESIAYDTGKKEQLDSLGVVLPIPLESKTRYYWKVRVWTEYECIQSDVAWFETAKMSDPWKSFWITPDESDPAVHPLLRKKITIKKEIESARIYACGVGLYEMTINDERVGDEYFMPFCNAYDQWLQYQTFDATVMLKKGENALGVLLGNGWYKGRFTLDPTAKGIYGNDFAFICEMDIHYTDGTHEIFVSDESWKTHTSFILSGNIYDGEIQDAGKKMEGWTKADFNDDAWQNAKRIELGFDRLEARRSIPVRIMETRHPSRIITTPKGETVLDMGQNMVGWIQFHIKHPQMEEIYLQYGEELQDGCFYRENLRSAKAEFRYRPNGQNALVHPYFTFYGFRYVKVEGWKGEINLKDFLGCVIYSDMKRTGTIETSDPLVNRLFLNALWGQKGNFLDVPTDCPQRDERRGWTCDIQVFSGTACFNMETNAFFHKYLYDLRKEQIAHHGNVPHVIPLFKLDESAESAYFPAVSSCAWGDAATIIPWNVFLFYGDTGILEQQFESMKDWVDTIRKQDNGNRLWNKGFHFGDWLSLDSKVPEDRFGGTSHTLIASAYYAYSAKLVSKAAKVLGKTLEEKEYRNLSDEVKTAIQNEFLTTQGRLAVDTQTAYVLVLFMDLAPEKHRKRLIEDLVKKIEDNHGKLETGFIGTAYLCRVLSGFGYNHTAYQLLLNEEYPGWLYEIKMGATTMWERWNSLLPDGSFSELGMNSLNHYAYGSIVEWMYRNMCGINPVEEEPGFRKIRLAPQPDKRIRWAKASLQSASGLIKSGWEYTQNAIQYRFTIPFNTSAEVVLKNVMQQSILMNGTPIENNNVKFHQSAENVVLSLYPGEYSFSVQREDKYA